MELVEQGLHLQLMELQVVFQLFLPYLLLEGVTHQNMVRLLLMELLEVQVVVDQPMPVVLDQEIHLLSVQLKEAMVELDQVMAVVEVAALQQTLYQGTVEELVVDRDLVVLLLLVVLEQTHQLLVVL